MTGLLPFDFLRREARVSDQAVDKGVLGAMPLGFVFGVGWTPCIGPALGAILALSANASSGGETPPRRRPRVHYALGLGLPFVLFGPAVPPRRRGAGFLRATPGASRSPAGCCSSLVGLAIATGLWAAFITLLRPLIGGLRADPVSTTQDTTGPTPAGDRSPGPPGGGPRLPEIPGPWETACGLARLRKMSTALWLLFALAAPASSRPSSRRSR
jgi:hypothetical protein